MRLSCLTTLTLLVLLPAGKTNAASLASKMPAELWYSIELQGNPIGGDHEVDSITRLNGRLCRLTTSTTHSSLKLFGTSVDQDVQSRDWVDYKTSSPVYEELVMRSSGVMTTVTASFSGKTITAVLLSGGQKDTKVLTVPPGCTLLGDDPTMMVPSAAKSGHNAPKLVYFDPASIAIEPVSITALGPKNAKTPQKIQVSMSTGTVTVTQDARGIPIRIDMPAGLSVVRGTAGSVGPLMTGDESITAQKNGAAPDFAVVTSVLPTGQPLIDHPTQLEAVVTMAGEAPRTISNVSQQKALDLWDGPAPSSILVPENTKQYLVNASYLGLDSPAIKSQAQNIINTRTNAYAIAVQIERWVHDNMTATASIGLPRSAVEILSDRRGVCRDYALLYTALARSAGVPTRVCAGLVGYHGRFYYHAWAESYIGGSIGWLTVDPTLDELPVDASHIALVQGDPAKLYDLVGKIGEISVNIISCS